MEGEMFNVKCTYLKIVDVVGDFWFSGVIENMLNSQHCGKLDIAKYTQQLQQTV